MCVVNHIQALSWYFHSAELMDLVTTYRLPFLFWLAFRSLADISLTQLMKHATQ
jgi:predicted DNA-binding ribbon-helix-helix protein